MARLISSVILLTGVYLLTLVSVDPWDIGLGAVIAAGTLWLFRRHLFVTPAPGTASLLRRAIALPWFVFGATIQVVIGTWQVAAIVLGLRPLNHPGIVRVPIGERTRLGVTISALEISLSPGSVLIDIEWEEGVMLIHTIDASDPDKTRREYQEFYERYQRPAFP